MRTIIVGLLLLYWTKILVRAASPAKLTLHKSHDTEIYAVNASQCGSGVLFDDYHEFSCACATGLWALYKENCEQAHMLIAGTNGQCGQIDFPVQKANLLSSEVESAAISSIVLYDLTLTSIGGKFVNSSKTIVETHFVPAGFPIAITTGSQTWRLPRQRLCLRPSEWPGPEKEGRQFCLFHTKVLDEYRMDTTQCSHNDTILAPLSCTSYFDGESTESKSCSRRVRRKAKMSTLKSKPKGRAFYDTIKGFKDNPEGEGGGDSPPAEGGENENATNIPSADENDDLNITMSMPMMNSELWNYITLRAQEKLGLRERRRKEGNEGIYEPAFTFLEISKEIQQKACPDHYVGDYHYDIAVGSFISILKNHFRYTDPILDFPTSERIEDTLRACLANMTEYPFLERVGKPREGQECNDTKPVEHGSYFMFDQVLEMALAHDVASRSNEPIVETVWKIFIHAHSACYPFFENNLNDHHRYTTVMLNLFTSEINDLWFNVTELTPEIYSGFLGDAVDLMDSVAYCSIFSRLESKYPWDLPRPHKENADSSGAAGGGGGDGGAPPASRRKREAVIGTEPHSGRCLQEKDAFNYCRPLNVDDDFVTGPIRQYLK